VASDDFDVESIVPFFDDSPLPTLSEPACVSDMFVDGWELKVQKVEG